MSGYSVFRQEKNDATKEPMFFGLSVNVARYDQQKHRIFEKAIERQLSFFWRPEEVDVSKDRIDYQNMPEHERHIFISNLKYQTLLDSVQGRAPNIALLPICSLPELETWIETWSFSETIHSRSYTHIIRNLVTDPDTIFDGIVEDEMILARAASVSEEYDRLIKMFVAREYLGVEKFEREFGDEAIQEQLFKTLVAVNTLEAIRFYVSFACTFAFGERGVMEANAKIMKFIARDEALHCHVTQEMIKLMYNGREGEMWKRIAERNRDFVIETMESVAEQEMAWADYLFKDGSMIGLNAEMLKEYVKHRSNVAMKRIGFEAVFPEVKHDPLPWMNNWLLSDNVQVAPQEAEKADYLTGQIDSEVKAGSLAGFEI
ncbi:ribonucleotide-diphosphate reductase subunit beta [Morganella psychrotolerans]|uniref:ribonucleoside-diphosphate reductase n=1 Tax=Morganella psychrotolerans TaxID=368603 RepID=A0A5M9QXT3_9GAMM|nr:class Ia ribonucleoside-diphosphate reductase subunit beta [Morganella psychrotolerans]KAA8712991.1 ribonucleotide-diphosphate reductase subunit beta [Morganella psychrotolerans]OBU01908.1 ribonucleotide-diphosphate reductase subunit beta [Morganella psychrotolerans]